MFLQPGQDWTPDTSWVSPPFHELNWSDCYSIGNFVAAAGLEQNFDRIPVNTTVPFARSLVPTNWSDPSPSPATLLIWAWSWQNASSPDHDITGAAWDMASDASCAHQICTQLQVEGDPDLAGIGMMVTYYLMATLSTVYSLIMFSTARDLPAKGGRWNEIVSWFRETTSGFLDASLIFAVAMLIAATYRFGSARIDPDQLDNAFSASLWNAIIVALFSLFPPLVLQSIGGDMLRRKSLRRFLWSLATIFTITSSVLFFIWYRNLNLYALSHTSAGSMQYLWNLCTPDLPGRVQDNFDFIIAAQVRLSLSFIRWLCATIVETVLPPSTRNSGWLRGGSHNVHGSRTPKHFNRALFFFFDGLYIVTAQVIMWLMLARLTILVISDAENAGASFEDMKWSVGQVLGLAQFVPVVIDLVTAGLYGSEAAWEGKMSKSLAVVDALSRSKTSKNDRPTYQPVHATTY